MCQEVEIIQYSTVLCSALHDHTIVVALVHLVDEAAGVARAVAARAALEVDDEHARVPRVHLGGEVVPGVSNGVSDT